MTTVDGTKHWDELVTVSNAPGYRDVSLRFRVHPGYNGKPSGQEIEINLKPADTLNLFYNLLEALELAWRDDKKPIDFEPGERRPTALPDRRHV